MSFFCIITIWFLNSYLSRYRTRAIISRGLYIYYPIFEVHFFVFKEFFFQKILFFCMFSVQERFLIKSGLWWRVYGSCGRFDFFLPDLRCLGQNWVYSTSCSAQTAPWTSSVKQITGAQSLLSLIIYSLGTWVPDVNFFRIHTCNNSRNDKCWKFVEHITLHCFPKLLSS